MLNEPFGTRLRARLDKYGPLCVGLDPSPELLGAWGLDDCVRLFERSKELGHPCRVHADQFNSLGATRSNSRTAGGARM